MTGYTSVENYKLLLDPPRSPVILARDSEVLVRLQRYMLAAASLIDIFPHTADIEAKALIVR